MPDTHGALSTTMRLDLGHVKGLAQVNCFTRAGRRADVGAGDGLSAPVPSPMTADIAVRGS